MANSSNQSRRIVTFLLLSLLFCPLVSCHKLPAQPSGTCPRNTLKLGVCADLLSWLINIRIGNPPALPCCSLIQGLVDLEAAACLCAAIRANVLGIVNVDINLALTLLVNACGKNVPSGFKCA